jgi:hypothetical protein
VPAHLLMELVAGPPITEYVEAHALGYAARIELMIAVCEGGAARARPRHHPSGPEARQRLVSDDGRPKILDFGIARANGLDVDSILQTAQGELLGTVPYMSPSVCVVLLEKSTPVATFMPWA